MLSMSDELKERNILKLILIVRFACATLDVGHPIVRVLAGQFEPLVEEEGSRIHALLRSKRSLPVIAAVGPMNWDSSNSSIASEVFHSSVAAHESRSW
jgi:hypothetical protein